MGQAAPTTGRELVFPHALRSLAEFAEDARPDLEFVLGPTLVRLEQRLEVGRLKYGTPLMTENGRNATQDAWEEAADMMFYLEQAMLEKPVNQRFHLYAVADLAREALLLLTEELVKQENGLGG